MRFLGFCVDNKGRAAVITLDPAAALPGDCSDLSAGHSGLCPRPLRGKLFVPRAPDKGGGEAELSWAINSRGDFEVGPCPQGGSREAEKISPTHSL